MTPPLPISVISVFFTDGLKRFCCSDIRLRESEPETVGDISTRAVRPRTVRPRVQLRLCEPHASQSWPSGHGRQKLILWRNQGVKRNKGEKKRIQRDRETGKKGDRNKMREEEELRGWEGRED